MSIPSHGYLLDAVHLLPFGKNDTKKGFIIFDSYFLLQEIYFKFSYLSQKHLTYLHNVQVVIPLRNGDCFRMPLIVFTRSQGCLVYNFDINPIKFKYDRLKEHTFSFQYVINPENINDPLVNPFYYPNESDVFRVVLKGSTFHYSDKE